MLDDLKLINDRDKEDALGVAQKQWQQLSYRFDADISFTNIENVVVSGMGGSALPAVFLRSWPELNVPLEIVRDYDIPKYVNQKTLFISCSYSGNTEETLTALSKAETKQAKIVIVSAGGKLSDLAKAKDYPLYIIPSGIQPRMSSFYFLAAYCQILEACQLIDNDSTNKLRATAEWLKDQHNDLLQTVPTSTNPAKKLALELAGKSVVIYSGPKLFPVANKFKICLNESSKNIAWVNQYPEFNHNEFMGWTSHPVDKPYAVVEIRSNLENNRVLKRFEVSEQVLSGMRPSPEVIMPNGETLPEQLLWTSIFCDFVSIYLAVLNGVDPTPVKQVERLKQMLG